MFFVVRATTSFLLHTFGVLDAVWITGITFNISSFVGVIMITGIVAENAIFVLHQVKMLQGQGIDLDAVLV